MTTCPMITIGGPTCFTAPGDRYRGGLVELKPFWLSKLHRNSAPRRSLSLTLAYWDGEFSTGTFRTSVERRKSGKCYSDLKSSETESSDATDSSSLGPPHCCNDATGQGAADASAEENVAASSTSSSTPQFETYGPGKRGNQLVALASVTVAVGLFALGRVGGTTPTLPQMAAQSTPYEEALGNGRPTVLEFYADWCEVCREMAKDVYTVEQEYKDKINFVMLNVDNRKWESELDEFGVEGIPHFAFLDGKGNEEGNIVGRLPSKILKENLAALARGDTTIPHSRVVGKFSDADSRQAPPVVEPRSHSQLS